MELRADSIVKNKAKDEIRDVATAIRESVNDRGDDDSNAFGQLSEESLRRTVDNIAGERLKVADTHTEIGDAFKDAYRDLGYEIPVI